MKWDYTTHVVPKIGKHSLDEELRMFGSEGWEIFQVNEEPDAWILMFKKPLEVKE